MPTKNITFRLDESLKKQAEIIFDSMGISMSAALQLFVTQAVASGSLPFAINADESAKHKVYVLRELAESKKEAMDPNNVLEDHDELLREWELRREKRKDGVQA